ncbi:hypothetical protein DV738_g1778, partial [Chaetothyriales sp. CBS 135597]
MAAAKDTPPILEEPLEGAPGTSSHDFGHPKLRRFPNYQAKIKWLELLGHGEEGIAFKAVVGGGEPVAIKVFWRSQRPAPIPTYRDRVYVPEWPFKEECRIVALLEKMKWAMHYVDQDPTQTICMNRKPENRRDALRNISAFSDEHRSKKRNHSDAISPPPFPPITRCHGWLTVSRDKLPRFHFSLWREVDEHLDWHWAIVYDFIPAGEPDLAIGQAHLDFFYLAGFDLYPYKHDNWRGGRLVDFGDLRSPLSRYWSSPVRHDDALVWFKIKVPTPKVDSDAKCRCEGPWLNKGESMSQGPSADVGSLPLEKLDPQGDLILSVGPMQLLVSSRILVLSSPFFETLLRPGTFLEGTDPPNSQDPPVKTLDDKDPDSFRLMCRALHYGFNMGRYVPPDLEGRVSFNQASGKGHALGKRASKLKTEGILTVRFECPFAIWCTNCEPEQIIGQGVRFNAEKKKEGNYYTTPIWSFRFKHTICGKWIEEEKERLEKEGGFATLEKKVQDRRAFLTQQQRIDELVRASDRDWSDPFAMSKKLRRDFRVGRRKRQADERTGEALKRKFGIGLDLLEEKEEDRLRARLVDFGIANDVSASSRRPLFSAIDDSNSNSNSEDAKVGINRGKRGRDPIAGHSGPASAKAKILHNQLMTNTRAVADPFLKQTSEQAGARAWTPS